MFGAWVRILILVTTLGIAWYATGTVMGLIWPGEPWIGYVGALGVELVLGYAIYTVSNTNQKAMITFMIVVFGSISIAAQILHAVVWGKSIDPSVASKLDDKIVWAWRYLLPSVPTLAGMCVGLLAQAEKSNFEEQILKGAREWIANLPSMFSRKESSVRKSFANESTRFDGEKHVTSSVIQRPPLGPRE